MQKLIWIIGGNILIGFVVWSAVLVYKGISPEDVVTMDLRMLKKQVAVLEENLRVEQEKMIILTCESKFQHDGIWGAAGKSYGIAQFQKVTFDELKLRAGKPNLKWTNLKDQLWLLDFAIRNGYAKKWSCSSERRGGK